MEISVKEWGDHYQIFVNGVLSYIIVQIDVSLYLIQPVAQLCSY